MPPPRPSVRRASLVGVVTTLIASGTAEPALAHGIGARGELPLPILWVTYAATAVIVATSLTLSRAWKAARFEGQTHGRTLPAAERLVTPAKAIGRTLGTVLLMLVMASAVRDAELPAYALFVGFWVLVPILSFLLGDVYTLLNPFAGLADVLDRFDLGSPPGWLERAGRYPAALLLLGFGWFELAYPDPSDADAVLGFLIAYTLVLLLGGIWWGGAWVRQADAFGVFFGLIGRLGPIGRDADGQIRLRPPLVGATDTNAIRGTAAVVLVAIGITSFDGLARSVWWTDVVGPASGWAITPPNTAALLVVVAIVVLAYLTAMSSAGSLVDRPAGELVEEFAHSLVPVAVGYGVAHYISLVLFDGQLLLAYASDPLGYGWDLFGTASNSIDFTVATATTIGYIQVAAILLGHVAGVVLAHDRAVARFQPEVAGPSQHALVGAMVLYTVAGLVMLIGA